MFDKGMDFWSDVLYVKGGLQVVDQYVEGMGIVVVLQDCGGVVIEGDYVFGVQQYLVLLYVFLLQLEGLVQYGVGWIR